MMRMMTSMNLTWMTTIIDFMTLLFSFEIHILFIKFLHFSKPESVEVWTC